MLFFYYNFDSYSPDCVSIYRFYECMKQNKKKIDFVLSDSGLMQFKAAFFKYKAFTTISIHSLIESQIGLYGISMTSYIFWIVELPFSPFIY